MNYFQDEFKKYEWSAWEYSGSKGVISLKNAIENSIPNKYGVYVIKSPVKLNRIKGESDISYMGQSGERKGIQGIKGRLFNTRGFEAQIRKKIESMFPDQLFKLECTFTTNDGHTPKTIEGNLLRAYLMMHFELPPANHQSVKGIEF